MDLKLNLKTTLTISLFGILLLLFLSDTLSPKQTNIGNITSKFLDKKIIVHGQITNIRTFEESNFQIISIKDKTGEINIILNKPLNLTNKNNITILGTVQKYNQSLQIQANKIILSKEK